MSKFIVMNTKKEVRGLLKELNITDKKEAKAVIAEAGIMLFGRGGIAGASEKAVYAWGKLKSYLDTLDGVTTSEFLDVLAHAADSVFVEVYGND